jgi:hypothetical protein
LATRDRAEVVAKPNGVSWGIISQLTIALMIFAIIGFIMRYQSRFQSNDAACLYDHLDVEGHLNNTIEKEEVYTLIYFTPVDIPSDG